MSHHYDGIDGTNANTDREPESSVRGHVDINSLPPNAGSFEDSMVYWQKEIMAWAEEKGWNQGLDVRSFGDWTSLLHTEISEAYEDYRNNRGYNEIYFEDKLGTQIDDSEHGRGLFERGEAKPCGIPIEMADLAIRLLHLAEFFKFDLGEMIAMKMAYNEKRPFRHGGKRI